MRNIFGRRPLPVAGGENELRAVLFSFKNTFVVVGFFSFLINLLMLVPAIYMLQIYDRVLISRNQDTLLMLTIIVILMYVVIGFLEWVRSQVLIRLSNSMDQRLSSKVFQATFEESLRFGSANATLYLHDLTSVRQFLSGKGLFAFFDSPWTPIFIAVIFYMHPVLGIFSLISAILLLGLAALTELTTRAPLAEASKIYNRAGAFAGANLRNAEAIGAMGMLDHIRKDWYRKHETVLKFQTIASDRAGVISSISKFVRLTSQSLILGLGAYYAIQNIITPGMMIAASILMGRALYPVEVAIGMWKQFLATRTSYKRLEEILVVRPEEETVMSLPAPMGVVIVRNLVAGPPGTDLQILKNISFGANPGDIVGIIGPSAAGKTTLARMIVGIWPPLAGEVRLDGVEVSAWDKAELGPYLGYLPQDIELLDGTVAQNIARFGEINSEKVVKAAKATGIHEMVLQFPAGYDTQVGENGLFLSGGQKQRIALARAIYGEPVLLMLDEPNSNLDEAGERALLLTLAQLKAANKTIFVIAHRASLLAVLDRILVLVNGTVQAFGPKDEVLASLQKTGQQQVEAAKS